MLSDVAPATLPSRSASRRSTAASAPSSNSPPYLVKVNATLLCPAHSETSRTLQPAATMIATKLCRSPWKVMSSNPARITAGRKTVRPHERKSGPPAGAVNTRASALGSTNSDEVLLKPPHDGASDRHGTLRACRLGLVVQGHPASQLDGRGGYADAGAQRVDVASA